MSIIESTRTDEWIFDQLSDDSTVIANTGAHRGDASLAGVYNPQAPEGSAYPLIRYQLISSEDVISMGTTRTETSMTYQVLGINQSESYQALETLMDRVDTLLTNPADTTVDGAVIIGAWREQIIKIPELVNGTQYRSLGGLYRVHVRPA